MIVYISSDSNQERLVFLKDLCIMSTEIRTRINQDSFMKYIKKELRNIEIGCLIVDIQIFDPDEKINLKEALDAYSLLNPKCKIIVMYENGNQMTEQLKPVQNMANIYLLHCNVSNKEIIDIINGVNEEKSSDTITDTSLHITDQVNDQNDLLDNEAIHIELEKLPPDVIYHKASKPIKLSEGEPLKKKAKKLPEIETPERSELMNLSSRVKRVQRYTDGNSPVNTPKPDNIWICKNIMIGILGTERRTGATTAALLLTNYLSSVGAKVIYTEANSHDHINTIAIDQSYELVDDHYINGSIHYYTNGRFDQDGGANFIIFDLGSLEENKDRIQKVLKGVMNEIIIVTGSKAYEHNSLDKCFALLEGNEISVLFNLNSGDDIRYHLDKYKDCVKVISNIGFEPDQNSSGQWPTDFTELFSNYNKEQQAVS